MEALPPQIAAPVIAGIVSRDLSGAGSAAAVGCGTCGSRSLGIAGIAAVVDCGARDSSSSGNAGRAAAALALAVVGSWVVLEALPPPIAAPAVAGI